MSNDCLLNIHTVNKTLKVHLFYFVHIPKHEKYAMSPLKTNIFKYTGMPLLCQTADFRDFRKNLKNVRHIL